ncbi:MAG: ligand-binding sensor domain-containing diguanylate cyclase [Crocinitomicaceae bacterium]
MKVLLLLILIVLFPIVTLGQSPYAVHYNSNSGLSSNVIYQAHQDKTGRVWFCSDQGVTLYNGYSFTQYTTDDGLGDNEVFQIHEDSKGRIWFLTLNGKVSYYKDGKFYNNDDHPEFNRLTFNGHLTGVQSFENGSICISSDDIMYVLDENLALADSATFRGMIQSTWAIKNTIYFVSVGGIFQYDFKNEPTRLDTVNWEKNYPRVVRSNGLTYIGSNHRIVELTDQNKTIIHEIDEITNEIISVNKINKDLWIGTRSGVVVYDPITKTVKNKLFTDDAVSSCISDFEGAIWVTTLNKGVHYIQNIEVKEVSGFSRTKVTCLEHYNDQLWAGLSKNRYATISKNGKHSIETISADVQDDISRIRVMKDASLWVIGKRVLMRSFDGKKTNWSHYLGLNDIYLSENQFWIGRRQGYLFPEEKFFHHLEITSSSVIHQEGFPRFKKLESRTNVFCEGREGTFWIGSEIGLYEVKNSGNPKLFSEKINGAVIDLIFSEKDQVLIVATRQNGIYIIKDHTIQKHFHNKNGLSGNLCRAVEIDTSGRIWVATHKGLDLVEIVTDGFRIKNQSNGIVSIDNINDLKIVEDRLYIATDSGIKYFSIEESINHAAKPILSFVQILVNNEKVDLNKKYHFSYHQNELEFEFIGVSFMLKNSLRYRYQLEGYDQEWYYSSERRINYKALPPGDYKFKVQVILPNDVPGELIVYDFSIEKPFWKSWWFIGLIVIVGGISAFCDLESSTSKN